VRGIGHVISVHAPRARLILRRRVQMRDPQLLKIREQIPGVRKPEVPIELYPVCRRWNFHGFTCDVAHNAQCRKKLSAWPNWIAQRGKNHSTEETRSKTKKEKKRESAQPSRLVFSQVTRLRFFSYSLRILPFRAQIMRKPGVSAKYVKSRTRPRGFAVRIAAQSVRHGHGSMI
jgi:hypothetical protein